MTSSLTSEEIAEESVIEVAAEGQTRHATVKFALYPEALERLVIKGTTERSLKQSQMLLLACGLYSMLVEMREEQRKVTTFTAGPSGEAVPVDVPAGRRAAELREAGRCAALAITKLQEMMHWAREAKTLVG